MKKLLVYLDQSYLSSMAKETTGKTRAAHAATGVAMGKLLRLLRDLVDRDKILCPSSIVHDEETGFDNTLEDAVYRILEELSDGISFYTDRDIQFAQTLRAMRRYLRLKTEPEDGRWEQALRRDPHCPIKRPRVYGRIQWHPVFTEDNRKRKARMHDFQAHAHCQRDGSQYTTFSDCRRKQVLGVVKFVYVEPLVDFAVKLAAIAKGTDPFPTISVTSSPQEKLDYLEAVIKPLAVTVFEEYSSLTGFQGLVPDKGFWDFFLSPEFDAVPYYDIFCSLSAGFVFHKPERKPRPSDPYDMAALASVLPYVDVVTTDSGMKDMLHQLSLDKQYGVEVYSSRLSDVKLLTQRLSQLA